MQSFPGESPPDIHPVDKMAWGVSMEPFEGYSYLGLVVRYSKSYESLSQRLETPLSPDKCYSFSAYLARSEKYSSSTPRSMPNRPENFTQPALIRIWGGDEYCWQGELLAQSQPVENVDWKSFEFIFKPLKPVKYITIEAYFTSDISGYYNGHVMVDALSQIIEMDCK